MNIFNPFDFYASFQNLRAYRQAFQLMVEAQATQTILGVNQVTLERVKGDLETLKSALFNMRLTEQGKYVNRALAYIAKPGSDQSYSALAVLLLTTEESVESGLRGSGFLWVNPDRNDLLQRKEPLFGSAVHIGISSASRDIEDAGNCLVAECNTAAVFHLMRVAEHGLRGLSRKLRVKLTNKQKNLPIDFADWGELLNALDNKISDARKLSKGPRRQERLEQYSHASRHCLYMKEIWRNNISHARLGYSRTEAWGVFERVRDFMQFLAGILV